MEYLNGLLQPWRRVPRVEFAVALTVLSAPGLIMLLGGMAEGGSSLLGPLLAAREAVGQAQQGNLAAVQQLLAQAQTATNAAPGAPVADANPINVAGLLDSLCLLLLTPFVRGRWLDMGYSAKAATVLTLVVQVSIFGNALAAVAGQALLPYGWLWGLLTLVGYTWLASRAGKPRKAVHERVFHGMKQADDDFPRF
jgi:hypothetical protein